MLESGNPNARHHGKGLERATFCHGVELSYCLVAVRALTATKWKKVGNEKQFKFNQSVEARFDSAISAFEKKKLDKAKKDLEEGKKLLS